MVTQFCLTTYLVRQISDIVILYKIQLAFIRYFVSQTYYFCFYEEYRNIGSHSDGDDSCVE